MPRNSIVVKGCVKPSSLDSLKDIPSLEARLSMMVLAFKRRAKVGAASRISSTYVIIMQEVRLCNKSSKWNKRPNSLAM